MRFGIEVGATVTVRAEPSGGGTPCLRGDAVELVEALSVRAPLPADTPGEWHRLLRGLATVFDAEVDPSPHG